ncbi:hypothetical protein GCM10007291_02820 [Gemmobacter nanjingensis]|uniref:Phage tail assembly chaperone n=1 Tax=Gemmobacter nanjingensis TaxID=488454 RepID=A0ABQ3F6P3_9RHOB|nr:rcc01693 family protein [Gemmobacter nanjingensis]GHC09902.1 hypothetical protein GCM10007291_02820 [Gemmobacter nanjingensis]
MSGIDWPGLMRAGLNGLGLTPAEFWRLTPVELRLMLGADRATPAMTRRRLDELAAAFPDLRKDRTDGGSGDA